MVLAPLQVRLAFVGMIGNWLLSLRERRDHEPRLLPYLLSGLCDDHPGVVGAAVELLDQLGQLYEKVTRPFSPVNLKDQ